MLRNQNPRGAACSGIPKEIPLWGVNICRNVSRIKRLKALSPSKIIPELGGQYDPEYPVVELGNCLIIKLWIGIANPWTTVRGCCRIGELFNCLTEGLAGVQSSGFGVVGESMNWGTVELRFCLVVHSE